MRKKLPLFFLSLFITSAVFAQGPVTDTAKKKLPPIQKFFVGEALDGAVFSSATIQKQTTGSNPTTTNSYGTLRFSYIVNFGFTFNFNLSRHLGIYTGIDVKNIGFIDNNSTGQIVKRRVYTLGAPVGIKIGNMARKGNYFLLGCGADAPFNYKEKSFEIRNQKAKFNEWFSDRTPAIMPYVFAGASIYKGLTLKVQYYPNNFMNTGFTTQGTQPYAGYNVHLILFSLGMAANFSKHHDIVKDHVAELKTM